MLPRTRIPISGGFFFNRCYQVSNVKCKVKKKKKKIIKKNKKQEC